MGPPLTKEVAKNDLCDALLTRRTWKKNRKKKLTDPTIFALTSSVLFYVTQWGAHDVIYESGGQASSIRFMPCFDQPLEFGILPVRWRGYLVCFEEFRNRKIPCFVCCWIVNSINVIWEIMAVFEVGLK